MPYRCVTKACLRAQSLPPLNTWNNFEGIDEDSSEPIIPGPPPTVPVPPWWLLPISLIVMIIVG